MALTDGQIAGIIGGIVILGLIVIVIAIVIYLMTRKTKPVVAAGNTVVILPEDEFDYNINTGEFNPVLLEEDNVVLLDDQNDLPLLPEDEYLLGDFGEYAPVPDEVVVDEYGNQTEVYLDEDLSLEGDSGDETFIFDEEEF